MFREACELHCSRNMYDADAIEAINVDQLVTATDRLLLRGHSRRGSRPTIDLTTAAAAALAASRARAAGELTVVVARKPMRLVGAAAFVAAAWLGVTFACLLV